MPEDEWDAISVGYTSGTTGDPKGVVSHHRGAYLLAQGNAMVASMPKHSVYLWTLPMFHCNGWCFPWTMSAIIGTHVCLRQVRAEPIWQSIKTHKVSHLCGAPIVMSIILSFENQQDYKPDHQVQFFTACRTAT
jgi:fatty-acyl-CoA synthase